MKLIAITLILIGLFILINGIGKLHNIYNKEMIEQIKTVVPNDESIISIEDRCNITECSGTKLYFKNDGKMMIGTEKNVTVPISYINEILNCEWELIDAYKTDAFYVYKWKHKETGEIKEGGIHPPSYKLNIKN